MMRHLSQWILKQMGWKVIVTVPDVPKCVICVAPHTSNCDFFLGKLAYFAVGRKSGFLMKKEWFFFPLGYLLRAMGGVPVYRTQKQSLVENLAEHCRQSKRFSVAITPEATRKPNPDWKKGFYYLALTADIPILLAYIDYGKKEIGLTEQFIPTGDEEKDMAKIKDFYRDKTAKYPEQFKL